MRRWLTCLGLILSILCGFSQAFAADTFAYIPNDDGNVTRVNAGDETFDSVEFSAGDPLFGAAVTPNGITLLVTNRGDLSNPGTLTLVNASAFLSTGAQFDRTVGVDPRGVAVDSQGNFAYVANFSDGTLSKVNMAALTVSGDAISVGGSDYGPLGVVAFFDEVDDINKVYVTNNSVNSVSVIHDDGVTVTLEAEIDVGVQPVGVAVTPDGTTVYVANSGSNTVSIIQTSDNTVSATLAVGNEPWGLAVGADGDFVYVTNSNSDNTDADTVMVIATSTQTVQNTFTVGDQPRGVAAPKNGDFAYVVNQGDDTISKIDMEALTATTIGTGEISNASALGAFIGATPPSSPSGLTATARSSDEIELSWTDNADDETGFKIERREDSETGFTQIAKADANATSFNDGSLRDTTTYHFRVRAFNEAADSAFSGEATATTEEGDFSWCYIQTLLN